MASPFAALAGLAKHQSARLSGEAVIFRPMARAAGPNGPASVDPSRPVVEGLVAIFAENADEVFETARVASFAPTPSAGSRLTATFEVGDLEIRTSIDRLERVDGGDVYTITEKQFDGLGGITCRLAVVAR